MNEVYVYDRSNAGVRKTSLMYAWESSGGSSTRRDGSELRADGGLSSPIQYQILNILNDVYIFIKVCN